MEKTDFSSATNGVTPPERYLLHDSVTGKLVPIRECPDEALFKAVNKTNERLIQASQHFQQALNEVMGLNGTLQTLQYELDRRARSIVVAGSIPKI